MWDLTEESDGDLVDPRRIWIANFPSKSTEYAILQLVRPFGKILDFNFPVYQSGGPLQGTTLGYCFVTYESEESALNAMKSLNRRAFAGAILSAQRARPTRETLDLLRAEREEAERARIEAERQRRETELAQRLTTNAPTSSVLITSTPTMKEETHNSSTTVVPDLYGKLGLISAKSSTSQKPPSPPRLSRAQTRQAMNRIEAALEAASKMEVQPAALRVEEGNRKPHPLVAALLAGGVKKQQQPQQQSNRYRRGRGGGNNFHRSHPYLRS